DGIVVNTVVFEPGGRTYWHKHEVAQVLFVTTGEGRLQSADGTGGTLRPGDVAHIPAGEVHWHGAAPGSLLVHVAVSVGKTEWMHEVSDEEYAEAFADGPDAD
ncbi:MAG: cupin domain-containing protein, partial [Actinobacteria bacterium]|nr:cupin domain-containing protein [Actinomycetota bacterium]